MAMQKVMADMGALPTEDLCGRCKTVILSAGPMKQSSKRQELAWVVGISLAFIGMMLVVLTA